MGYKNIMVAVGFDDHAQELLHKAESVASHYVGAKLSIIHVDMDVAEFYQGAVGLDLRAHEIAEHQESVHEMKHLIESMSMPVSKHLLYAGTVENEIVHAVENNDIDLLIMGHHKTNAFTQFFSETEPLVRMMPCDVMLVRLER